MAQAHDNKPRAIETIVWLLRCYKCRAEFEVRRLPSAEIIAAALESECPHCSAKPAVLRLGAAMQDFRLHDIVGLRDK